YYLVGGRAFFAQQEIYDLLNLLRALENPQDAVSLAGTLRSPFCCLSDEALFYLGRHADGLWAGLHDRATCERLPADQQPAGDRVRTQPREEQAATQPENADVVRLMTIHQAKGLEFPVVFVPDLAATTGGGQYPVARWDAELGCVVRPPKDEEPLPFPEFGWE